MRFSRDSVIAGIVCLVLVSVAGYAIFTYTQGDAPESENYSTFICTETGKSFRHKNEIGESLPILSPFSGKNTGLPAEACFWTRDGGSKTEPTWVLLNEFVKKPGPTFCPDCGRLVVGHNPPPGPKVKPPPTQAEWAAKRAAKGTSSRDEER